MSQVLEAVMLICFGLSWPISLIKNIKLKSAKSMNIYFTLLIIIGYLAGIAAKVINGQFNYVFAIYLLNLAIVSGNVVVFFINRGYDKKKEEKESVSYAKQNHGKRNLLGNQRGL